MRKNSASVMRPLRFAPLLKRSRWGGRRLATRLGKPLGPENDYAESWEICDHGDDQSVVCGGPFSGWTLERLVAERSAELLGRHAGAAQFPLLLKFLDACDRLSVQVHPNDQQAPKYDPRERGKTEAWVVLDATPAACVFAGLRQGIDRQELSRALHEGSVGDCLHRVDVAPGDCLFIPAGTVHAIGEGVLLAEVQQASDLTFRLFDWNRTDALGRPRGLHVTQALECTDFGAGPVNPVVAQVVEKTGDRQIEQLVRCPYFTIRRHAAAQPLVAAPADHCRLLMLIAGGLRLDCPAEGEPAGPENLTTGQTVLIPAACPALELTPSETAVWLEIFWE
ncbi:MAG: type I phosphomannose isomerase catalytic subunit [Planctomycetaceae bacterium]